ncbi:transposase [Psychrobacter urativorans]|uniref:transposase n=1 Tax=Psychrobacter urativorans TaxID=45610 RepID=UPI00191A1936
MLFALDCLKTNINKEVFYHWCKFTLIPKLKKKCVIIMDNAAFHKNKRVQKLLNRHGHRLLFLPPYSPDLNPQMGSSEVSTPRLDGKRLI